MHHDPNQTRDPLGKWVKEHNISPTATARDIISHASITDLKIIVDNPSTPQTLINKLAITDFEINHPYTNKKTYLSPNGTKSHDEGENYYNYLQEKIDYDCNVRLAALREADRETVNECRFDENPEIRASVAELTDDPYTLSILSEDNAHTVRLAVAANRNTGSDTIDALSKDRYAGVQANVITNHDVGPEAIDRIVRQRWGQSSPEVGAILRGAAQHYRTSPGTLDMLAQSENALVRADVADNEHTSKETLKNLAYDKDSYVREHVAFNSHTPKDALGILAEDDWTQTRINVAVNPNTSPETLDYLSTQWSPHVKRVVARNSHATSETLERLTKDEDKRVRVFARSTLRYKRRNLSSAEGNNRMP